MSESPQPAAFEPFGGRSVSGRWVVLAMFLFAIAITGTLYVYWSLHRGPFLPLQKAIAAEWEGSRPLVEGGQRKMHRDTPAVLRVILEVEFDPNAEENRPSVDAMTDRLLVLAREHHDLAAYDLFEAYLFQQERERQLHEHRVTVDLETNERTHDDSPGP